MTEKKKKNNNLHKAAKNKNDEFYTRLADIEKEVMHYREYFKDKIVYCNCDDPEWSNFFVYFNMNFRFLGLKKLITTHYKMDGSQSYKLEIMSYGGEILKTPLSGNGDFRSDECIEILKEADIVLTNPPFSLFREYLSQLIEYKKDFLIIGNNNAITYKDVFQLIKENRLWQGVSPRSMKFILPDETIKDVNANWFTNLEHKKRNEEMILFKTYIGNEEDYPSYFNFEAIEVSKTNNIPVDYDGMMGVPITFLSKYNPKQFDIVGLGISNSGKEVGVRGYTPEHKKYRKEVQKRGAVDGDLYMIVNGEVKVPYARILIKKKK